MEFLSGYESEVMLDAHFEAIRVVGEPFSSDEPYNFVEKAAYKRVTKLLEVFADLTTLTTLTLCVFYPDFKLPITSNYWHFNLH